MGKKLFCRGNEVKRGQVTVFIILGILMLFAVVTIFYLAFPSAQKKIETPNQIDSPDIAPVKEYARQCIVKFTLEGINLLGIEGGHIYSYPTIENVDLPNDEDYHVVGNARLEKGTGNNRVAYWLTDSGVAVPTVEFMQNELTDFLEENVPKCADFSYLTEQGYTVSTGKLTANISMGAAVVVDIDWPTTVSFSGKKYTYDKYSYEVPVNLGLLRNIAEALTGYEVSTSYLESHAKNIISIYSYSGGAKGQFELPPFSFTDPSCSYVTWTLPEAEAKTRAILDQSFGYLKIANTSFEKKNGPVYDSFIWQFFPSLPTIKIDFKYDQLWPTDFDIQPRSGTTIKPDKFSQSSVPFLPMFCFQKYRNKYSIKAPIQVKITDADSAKVG